MVYGGAREVRGRICEKLKGRVLAEEACRSWVLQIVKVGCIPSPCSKHNMERTKSIQITTISFVND